MKNKPLKQSLAGLLVVLSGMGLNTANACTDDMIGTMVVFAGNFAPRGCAFAHGQLLDISTSTALFSILGTTYGGDGRTTFALPDTRGRSVIGAGTGDGLTLVSLGEVGGAETVTLTTSQLPSHSHTASAEITAGGLDALLNAYAPTRGNGNNSSGSDQYLNATKATIFSNDVPNVTLSPMSIDLVPNGTDPGATVTVDPTGGGQPVNIRDPYIGINWLIVLQGFFPS